MAEPDHAGRDRGVPLILINGRLSERSFKRWRHMPRTIEALLQRFDLCLMRSPSDAKHFSELGAPRLSVVGNLKLDVPQLPVDEDKLIALVRRGAGTHRHWRPPRPIRARKRSIDRSPSPSQAANPHLITIIAPRHPERGAEIAAIAASAA